jgi:hypothetical protein
MAETSQRRITLQVQHGRVPRRSDDDRADDGGSSATECIDGCCGLILLAPPGTISVTRKLRVDEFRPKQVGVGDFSKPEAARITLSV